MLQMTNVCNWDCNYCITDTPKSKKNKRNISLDGLLEKIKDITEEDMVSLNGGEPGLVKEYIMRGVMDELIRKKCEIRANTNGQLFIRYEKYLGHIREINYHCSVDLDDDIRINKINYSGKLNYILVVTDMNFKNLDSYLKKYPEIKFRIYGAAKPYSKLPGREYLSKKNALKIIKDYKDKIDSKELKKIFHNNCTVEITNL